MRVIYHNRSRVAPRDRGRAERANTRRSRTCCAAPITSCSSCRTSTESHHTIGAAELALMKPTATLTNIARGGIVDDAALVDALRTRQIAAAGLDVFEGEPNLQSAIC